ncbi:uncharacterized protein LOC123515697 [Portunus trituberculatus]|uniref:uncharacterized protein LOC123515697 n=1 Tax=Portunus trituberculatus TaxID=210409 RepID=UPI001E1D0510|nr:uncharacterized protein LOC123515697 [Portunus trituberculatus]
MVGVRRGLLPLLTLPLLLVVAQVAEAPLPPVMCLLEKLVEMEGRKQLRYITCNRVPALGVYHLIPLKRLCDDDQRKMTMIEDNAQEVYDKCCRLARPVYCTEEEWRIVTRIRYRIVFCTHHPELCRAAIPPSL